MNMQDQLREAAAGPIESPDDAEKVREAADLLAAYFRLDERAARVLAPEEPPTGKTGGDLRGATLDDAAERVLRDAGVPLHARELGARIKARGWRHPRSLNARPDQIVFQLAARLPRQPHRFRRVAPNTFALAKWDPGGAPNRQAPRVALFRGPGSPIGRTIGESEAPASEGESDWRS